MESADSCCSPVIAGIEAVRRRHGVINPFRVTRGDAVELNPVVGMAVV
jgi:hypothetical protein